MESALMRLKESQNSMSATERSVSDYLLAHEGEVMELSIHQLAERTFASTSTVIRMCQRVGFAGYKDFRQAVTCEVAVRGVNRRQERCEITQSDSLEDIVDKVTHKNIMTLEDTKSLIDIDTLRACVELVRDARTVLLFGLGASLSAVQDLNLRLLRINKPCVVNDNWRAQLLQAGNAGSNDLGIVVSRSGETAEMVECMKVLREQGAPIVAITRQASSPVASLADYCLYSMDDEAASGSGAASSRMSQLNLIDILFTAFANSKHGLDQAPRAQVVRPQAARRLGTA